VANVVEVCAMPTIGKGDLVRRFSRCYLLLLFVTTFFLVQTDSLLWAQGSSVERIFFDGKVFTGDAQNPYAEAVAIRGDKIIAVGNFPEVAKSVSENAEHIDLEGKSLFPGFIDSHSHSIDGGLGLISADASEKVKSLNDLPPFAEDAKKTGKGIRGDILEILGLPLEFWSHCEVLNAKFSTGAYEKQSVLLRGMDGHTAWANRALLQRAGITADFLKKLSVGSEVTTAWIRTCSRMAFWSTPARRKSNRCCLSPPPTGCWRRGAPLCNTTTASASRHGSIRWPAIMF